MVVVVTGLPGAGKSTLARSLSGGLGVPLFSLDAIKEALYDAPGGPDRSRSELRFSAEAVLAALVGDAPRGAVVDIWLDPTRADRERLRGALPPGVRVVEVLCDVPAGVALERYAGRARHRLHLPADPALERQIRVAADLIAAAPADASGGLGAVIRMDTTRAVSTGGLICEIEQVLRGGGPLTG